MQVHFSVVGFSEKPEWESGKTSLLQIPREGEGVEVPGLPKDQVFVRTVVYYFWGNPSEGIYEPFVYIVLGPKRRG